ncbi:MAG TPA: hypothetical protein DGM69_04095, partial [Chloroflexi bacterium]|nr:hypothetical protein [Chloroflexota bacterium]
LKDQAGNEIVDAGWNIPGGQNLADTKNIKIDAVYPTITDVTSTTNNGTYKIGDNINLTLSFNEELTLANGTLDVTLNHGNTGNAKQSINAFTDKNTITGTYTVAATDTTDDLDHTSIALGGSGTLKDGGGNQPKTWTPTNQTLAQNKNIKIDGNRPTILKIRSSKPAGFYKVGDIIPIQIYFTEAVTTTAANILSATLETGSTNSDAVVTFGAISNSGMVSKDYQVRTNDLNPALTVNSVAVSGGQRVNDQAGNEMTDKSIP